MRQAARQMIKPGNIYKYQSEYLIVINLPTEHNRNYTVKWFGGDSNSKAAYFTSHIKSYATEYFLSNSCQLIYHAT
jgi:hypothetical protein